MRTAKLALALLLAFAVPVRAETTADPLWYLLSTYVVAPDAKAVEAQGDGPADAKGLAALQADLLVLIDGFEGFRDEIQVRGTLERLRPRMSPELRPFFKDRASSLDAIYRTLAVTDYTWAKQFPEPPCEPTAARRRLLSSRDGLFQTENGVASPWLSALLGPQAEGKSAELALDEVSTHSMLTGAEYEKLRARVRKLTLALASDKAVGAARSKLYCSRAAAFTDLAAAQRVKDASLIAAARVVAQKPEESVFVVVWKDQRAAATLLKTKTGPVLVTDAALVTGTDRPNLFAYSMNSKPVQLTATVVRRNPELGVAVLTYSEDLVRPALVLSNSLPAKGDLVTAIGHTMISGLWTRTSGLVTKVGQVSFQTDAAISPELSGGPIVNETGEAVGMLVLRPADTEEGRWPVGIPASVLVRWLDFPEALDTTTAVQVPEAIEDDGTSALLTRAHPNSLTDAGLGAWNIPNLPPPPSVPNGVCVQNCGGGVSGSSNSGGYSGGGNGELGQALGELGAVLILKGIPALFRGLGKLFKREPKSKSQNNPPASITSKEKSAPPPEEPKPLPPVLTLTIRTSATKDQLMFTGVVTSNRPDLPVEGNTVRFQIPGSTETFSAITNSEGVAIFRVHQAHSVAAMDALDAESAKHPALTNAGRTLAQSACEVTLPVAGLAILAIASIEFPAVAAVGGIQVIKNPQQTQRCAEFAMAAAVGACATALGETVAEENNSRRQLNPSPADSPSKKQTEAHSISAHDALKKATEEHSQDGNAPPDDIASQTSSPGQEPPDGDDGDPEKATKHGADRISDENSTRGGTLSREEIRIARNGKEISQGDGAKVFIQEASPGKFNVVVQGERGIITTFKHLSQKSLLRLANNYGWKGIIP